MGDFIRGRCIMFVLKVTMRAAKGMEDELEQLWRRVAPKVHQSEKDTLMYMVHRKIGDPAEFFLYEQYRDREAWEVTHLSAPYIKEMLATLPNLVEGEVEVLEYEAVEVD